MFERVVQSEVANTTFSFCLHVWKMTTNHRWKGGGCCMSLPACSLLVCGSSMWYSTSFDGLLQSHQEKCPTVAGYKERGV